MTSISTAVITCLVPAIPANFVSNSLNDLNVFLGVAINGNTGYSTCAGGCTFKYSTAITPKFTSVSPTALTAAGTPLTITGTGFTATASDHTVVLNGLYTGNGAFPCTVTASTTTSITCTPAALPYGSYQVRGARNEDLELSCI